MGKPERTILAIGGGVLAIVLLAVTVVLVFGAPDVEEFPADSPPGAVQRYLNALHARDYDAAEALLSARVLREFNRDEINRVSYCPTQEGRRVRVVRTDQGADRATVVLMVEHVSGSGLSFDRYSYEQTVALVREDDIWKIDEPYFCV